MSVCDELWIDWSHREPYGGKMDPETVYAYTAQSKRKCLADDSKVIGHFISYLSVTSGDKDALKAAVACIRCNWCIQFSCSNYIAMAYLFDHCANINRMSLTIVLLDIRWGYMLSNTLCSIWRIFDTNQILYRAWCECQYKDKKKVNHAKRKLHGLFYVHNVTNIKNDQTLLHPMTTKILWNTWCTRMWTWIFKIRYGMFEEYL